MRRLLEQDAVDDRTDDLVEAPQVDADDGARDDHDDDALERLVARRPVDLAQLGVRLADELAALLLGLAPGLLLDGLLRRADLLRARAARARSGLTCGCACGAPLPAGLACHLPRLPMHRVRAAPAAVLLELHPVGGVSLGLLRLVVAPLALGAGERDRDSYSGCHCSLGSGGTKKGCSSSGGRTRTCDTRIM